MEQKPLIPSQAFEAETDIVTTSDHTSKAAEDAEGLAKAESRSFREAELEEAKIKAEKERIDQQSKRNSTKNILIIWSMRFLFGLACVTLFVYASHMLLPEKCHWLNDHQLSKLETTFIGGILGAMLRSVEKYV